MVQCPTTVDRVFAALADPSRRAVLERLGAGSATISELAEPFGMSLTGMKKHIRLLEQPDVLLHSGQRHAERLGELGDRRAAGAEPFEDGATGRVGEGCEGAVVLCGILNH